ncbi:MAG: hypothetical protein ACOVOR_02670 [Rhabdochlamydiaceae bacterium]
MLIINHINSQTFKLVDSPRYPTIKMALGTIASLGIIYLCKKDASFLSAKKIFVGYTVLSSLVFMTVCSRLRFVIESLKNEGTNSHYQIAQIALNYQNKEAYHHYINLAMNECQGDTKAEKAYQLAQIALKYQNEEAYRRCINLAMNECQGDTKAEKAYQLAQIALKHEKANEWIQYLKLAADQGNLEACQKLSQYYYDTGFLLLSKKYLSDKVNPFLIQPIEKELKKINSWNQMPLETFIYTDTYQPSHQLFCEPQIVLNIIFVNVIQDEVFFVFNNVEQIVYRFYGDQPLSVLIDKLPALERLKTIEVDNTRVFSVPFSNGFLKSLKKCPYIESLKLNHATSTFKRDIDASFFPRVKTLEFNQPFNIINLDDSSIENLHIVVSKDYSVTAAELNKLKNLKSLSLKILESSKFCHLNLSYFKKIERLNLKGSSENWLQIQNLDDCPYLNTLELENCQLIDRAGSAVLDLSYLRNLKKLIVKGMPNKAYQVKNWADCVDLNILELDFFRNSLRQL